MKSVLLSIFIALVALYNHTLKADLLISKVFKNITCTNENNATLCEINYLFIQYPGIYINCLNCMSVKPTTTKKPTVKKTKTTKGAKTTKTKKEKATKASLVNDDDILSRNKDKYKFDRYVARADEQAETQPAATTAASAAGSDSTAVPGNGSELTTPEIKTTRTRPIEYINTKECVLIRSVDMKYLPYNLADAFPKLITLIVWRTGLVTINDELSEKEGVFPENLQEINVRNNEITSVMELAFKYTVKLHTIDLSMNKITTLGAKLFVTLSNLQKLILNNNRIVMLPENMLTMNNPIVFFNVNDNLIEEVQLDFTALAETLNYVLGVNNKCASFSMNKKKQRTVEMLQEVIRKNCTVIQTTVNDASSTTVISSSSESTAATTVSMAESSTEAAVTTVLEPTAAASDETTTEAETESTKAAE